MKTYHGTEEKFKNFDLTKSTEIGLCFSTDLKACKWYGEIIYTVELSWEKALDLRTEKDAKIALSLCPALVAAALEFSCEDEMTIDEIVEDAFDDFKYVFQEHTTETKNGESVRVLALEAFKKAGYDCVIFEDNTNDIDHETYLVLNSSQIKKLN